MSLQLRRLTGIFCTVAVLWCGATLPPSLKATADQPGQMRVRLDTSKGAIVIAVHRDWGPHGADRFLELVNARYFDDSRFFRCVKDSGRSSDQWGSERATAWRQRTIPDDPRGQSVTRGRAAFAFATPNGRTLSISPCATSRNRTIRDSSRSGEVVEGMDVRRRAQQRARRGLRGGIRAGRQQPAASTAAMRISIGSRLDRLLRARVVR